MCCVVNITGIKYSQVWVSKYKMVSNTVWNILFMENDKFTVRQLCKIEIVLSEFVQFALVDCKMSKKVVIFSYL